MAESKALKSIMSKEIREVMTVEMSFKQLEEDLQQMVAFNQECSTRVEIAQECKNFQERMISYMLILTKMSKSKIKVVLSDLDEN